MDVRCLKRIRLDSFWSSLKYRGLFHPIVIDSPASGSDTLWSRCRARLLTRGAFLYGRMHCCLVQPIAESRQIHDNVISRTVIKFMIKRQKLSG